MLKLLLGALVVVLAGIAYVSGSAAIPQGMSQFAPPPTPAAGEVSFELTQAQLSDRMRQQLVGQSLGETPLGKATLTRLSCELKPNQLIANGDADVGGTSVPVSMTGHVDMQSNRPVVIINDARAAGVPLPEASRESIRKSFQDQVDQEIARLQMRVTSVTITQGKLLVIGIRAR
ncbi:MAG TPA: hypothetical protein VGL99_16170 [Chloroflexota bacterium]|jgi:hypothetical protein